jgi:uroporphyrin-III C-methyltransferase
MLLPLLTTHDATGHVHLIVGSTPLASARCAKSLDAGARPVLIAPANSSLQPSLLAKIEQDQVQWIRRAFIDDDLQNLGRSEVGNVVDAVFVTLGPKNPLSECS